MNGCHYKLTGNTTGSDPGTDATVWIECPAGKTIVITGPLGLEVTVPAQTPTSGGVVYRNLTNHSGGAAVEVEATVTGITYECHPALTCATAGVSTHGNDADYTGTVIATGYTDNPNNPTTLPTPVTEGPQVGVSVS
jgi:hypothetical protein